MSEEKDEWEELMAKASKQFNISTDFESILFIIGIQERGLGFVKYLKEDKIDMINLARCVLFEQSGYYKRIEPDEQGWPRFEVLKKIDILLPGEREAILKKAMITYLKDKL